MKSKNLILCLLNVAGSCVFNTSFKSSLLKLSPLLSEGLNSGLCPTDSLDSYLLTMRRLGHIRGALVLKDE